MYFLFLLFLFHSISSLENDQKEGCIRLGQPPEPWFYVNEYSNSTTITSLPDWCIKQMEELLSDSLAMIEKDFPPGKTSSGWGEFVFYGASGRAFMYMRIYENSHDETYLELAKTEIDFSLIQTPTTFDKMNVGLLKGRVGVLAVALMIYSYIEDSSAEMKSFHDEVISIYEKATIECDFPFDNGLGGLLNTARMLKNFFNEKKLQDYIIPDSYVDRVGSILFERGLKYYNSTKKALQYGLSIHNSFLIGVGAGSGGCTFEIMKNPNMMNNETVLFYIKQTVYYYLSQLQENGDMISDPYYPERVQWCHGSPGFIGVFKEAYQLFGDEQFLTASKLAGAYTQYQGILRKGMLLGHGIAGNIYMAFELYALTKDPNDLSKALSMLLTSLKTPEATDLTKMISYDCVPGSWWLSSVGGMISLFSDVLTSIKTENPFMDIRMPLFGGN